MHAHSLSHVQLFVTPLPCIVAHQAPLSMEFTRQKYWSGSSSPTTFFNLHLKQKIKLPPTYLLVRSCTLPSSVQTWYKALISYHVLFPSVFLCECSLCPLFVLDAPVGLCHANMTSSHLLH